MTAAATHQYIDRASGTVRTERLYRDSVVSFLYGPVREYAPAMFRSLVSRWNTSLLGYLNYDVPWSAAAWRRFAADHDIDLTECLDDPARFRTARDFFERRIRYWECRPMPADEDVIVVPSDARAIVGSAAEASMLFIKEKFFSISELLGRHARWVGVFVHGDFAVFRLTPDKYHFNHSPVTGVVVDHFPIDGAFHSCNPLAAVVEATPYTKNARHVTVIDTDVPGGTRAGLVAMIEIVALMIGEISQCASDRGYGGPAPLRPGTLLRRGEPKSLFRPGSSTTVLLFEPGRASFADDLMTNRARRDASSRYAFGLNRTVVETDVAVRSFLALSRPPRQPLPEGSR